MFEKFKSVNPTLTLNFQYDFVIDHHHNKEESPKHNEIENLYESKLEKYNVILDKLIQLIYLYKIKQNTLDVGFKRKNTRKST